MRQLDRELCYTANYVLILSEIFATRLSLYFDNAWRLALSRVIVFALRPPCRRRRRRRQSPLRRRLCS
jgi:hypothetical protein